MELIADTSVQRASTTTSAQLNVLRAIRIAGPALGLPKLNAPRVALDSSSPLSTQPLSLVNAVPKPRPQMILLSSS